MRILRNLEMRVARLEKQSTTTKQQAYDALRAFIRENKTNRSILIEIGGYLKVLKDGGDLKERDLKTIRRVLHRNNASDLTDMFRTNPVENRPKPKPKPKPLSIKEIIRFLEREAETDIGGGFHSLLMYRGNSTYWEFQMEPGDRQRQDHWHFVMPNYDHEEDDRDRAWSDWEYNWAYPLQEETEQALRDKFPVLADNRQWGVMVGEKGHIEFQFPKDLISEE